MPSQPDQGENGQSLPLPPVVAVVMEQPADPPADRASPGTRLFGLLDTGELYSSLDHGARWSAHSMLPVYDAVGLAAGRHPGELLLANRGGLLHRSDDGGFEWQALSAVPAADIVDLAILGDLSLVLLTASGRIYRSVDLGVSFRTLLIDRSARFVRLARTGGRILAFTHGPLMAESGNGGATWDCRACDTLSGIVAACGLGGNVYAIAADGTILHSADGGGAWTRRTVLASIGWAALASDGEMLVAASHDGRIAISPDGSQWRWQGAIGKPRLVALATDRPAARGTEGDPSRPG